MGEKKKKQTEKIIMVQNEEPRLAFRLFSLHTNTHTHFIRAESSSNWFILLMLFQFHFRYKSWRMMIVSSNFFLFCSQTVLNGCKSIWKIAGNE